MKNYLYRFRSIKRVHQELEKQTIFFASPEELNDPMEGYKDIFWAGDKIVWRNLLKHYLMCLSAACLDFPVYGEEVIIKNLPTLEYQKLHDQICDVFFTDEDVNKYPEWLAQRKSPVRRNELFVYLQSLHIYALECIFLKFAEHNLATAENALVFKSINRQIKNAEFFNYLNKLEEKHHNVVDGTERFLAEVKHSFDQQILTHKYNSNSSNMQNRNWIVSDFPEEYLNKIEDLIHPKWYVACFSSSYNNSSLWGHYGDGHKGVCLKFRDSIALKCKIGISGSKDNVKTIYDNRPFQVYTIDYQRKYPQIDFFKNLGVLPISTSNKMWYTDGNRNISSCAGDIYKNEELWRKKYWEGFYAVINKKSEDWQYEEEQRIILTSMGLFDYSAKEERALEYNFAALEGIIFGIKTPPDKRLEIIKIIEKKCRENSRTNFNFYQAYYCKTTGKIEARDLQLQFNNYNS